MPIDFTTALAVLGCFLVVVLLMRLAPREDARRRRADDAPLSDRGNWR